MTPCIGALMLVGSSAYGEKFAAAIANAFPDTEFYDLMTDVDSAVERGFFAAALVMCPIVTGLLLSAR